MVTGSLLQEANRKETTARDKAYLITFGKALVACVIAIVVYLIGDP